MDKNACLDGAREIATGEHPRSDEDITDGERLVWACAYAVALVMAETSTPTAVRKADDAVRRARALLMQMQDGTLDMSRRVDPAMLEAVIGPRSGFDLARENADLRRRLQAALLEANTIDMRCTALMQERDGLRNDLREAQRTDDDAGAGRLHDAVRRVGHVVASKDLLDGDVGFDEDTQGVVKYLARLRGWMWLEGSGDSDLDPSRAWAAKHASMVPFRCNVLRIIAEGCRTREDVRSAIAAHERGGR